MIDELRIWLPANVAAARAARKAVVAFDGCIGDALHAARLVVSELVTNSLLHGNLGPRDLIALALEVENAYLRIEVGDRGDFVKPLDAPYVARGSGVGMKIVDELCEFWRAGDGRVTAWLAV